MRDTLLQTSPPICNKYPIVNLDLKNNRDTYSIACVKSVTIIYYLDSLGYFKQSHELGFSFDDTVKIIYNNDVF